MPRKKAVSKKALRAVGYIRVSTDMQAEEGYSLENQEYQIKEFAEWQKMKLVHIYKEEKGASGKNIEGRPQFQQMLADIAKNRDIDYVVVLNMSRFARNAADALVTLNKLKSYNVNLYLLDDKLDTSSKTGSAMFSLSSIFAELERNNIRENTTAGRYQKARNGLWNGAQAPFGYRLDNGKLVIEESEAEVVRIIFDRYVHTPDGIHKIAVWLNEHGYKKEPRGNGKYVFFSPGTLKNIIDNPVYAGKIAYGRRRMEQIDDAERKLDEAQRRLDGAREGEATVEEVKLFLTEFGKAIGKVDKATRKTLYAELIDTIEIVPDADWKHGEGIVSRIRFKLPMIYGDKRTLEVSRREDGTLKPADKEVGNKYFRVTENTDECVALLVKA